MKKIFIVDDNNTNLIAAQKALSKDYNTFTLPSATALFELLEEVTPDLLLLDIKMPEMDGFEVMEMLKKNEMHKRIPVIFLTGQIDTSTEVQGFQMGAVDFIPKPFSGPVLVNRIKTHLEIEALIRDRTEKLQLRTEKLQKLQNSMVSVLANMVENRDKQTGKHVERTSKYIKILLEAMIEHGVYSEEIRSWDTETAIYTDGLNNAGESLEPDKKGSPSLDMVISSARLHDIGKITVTDLVLNKPGRLTEEEFELIKIHTIEGEKIIDGIIAESGDELFLQNAKLFAGNHHERWDGTGYPRGLKGEDIPLQGRVMAIVDVYDALISDRAYKKAFTHEKAIEIILESSGSHFDPKIVDVFLEISGLFKDASCNL